MRATGQVGRDLKADGLAHGQAARLVGLLSDGSSCPEQGELADLLAGGGPPVGLKGAGDIFTVRLFIGLLGSESA